MVFVLGHHPKASGLTGEWFADQIGLSQHTLRNSVEIL
jgi:hypothetical protein